MSIKIESSRIQRGILEILQDHKQESVTSLVEGLIWEGDVDAALNCWLVGGMETDDQDSLIEIGRLEVDLLIQEHPETLIHIIGEDRW